MEEKKLNILFVSSWYPNKYRPVLGIFVKRQAASVATLCHVSAIYICSGIHSELAESVEDGVYTIRAYFKKVHSKVPVISQLQRISRYISAWRKAVSLYEKNKGRPDLIHAHIAFPVGLIANLLSKKWRVPYIISEQCSGYFPQDGRYTGLVMKTVTRLAVRGASALITISASLKKAMQDVGLNGNYSIISNTVNTDMFSLRATSAEKGKSFRFIHVSSLFDMEKNTTGIVRAFNQVHARFPDALLVIVGDGENRPALERLANFLGLADAITFTGQQPPEKIAMLLKQSDAFVLFSNFETQCVALLEALCCGLPSIATACGGPTEYMNADNGILIEPGNEKQLVAAMSRMIEKRNTFNPTIIRQSVMDMVQEKNVAQKIVEVYNSVIKK